MHRSRLQVVLIDSPPDVAEAEIAFWAAALGHEPSVFKQSWPQPEREALARDEITIVVQVDGKVRSRLTIDAGAPESRVQDLALADDRVRPWLAARRVARVVTVPGRLVNIVTRAS